MSIAIARRMEARGKYSHHHHVCVRVRVCVCVCVRVCVIDGHNMRGRHIQNKTDKIGAAQDLILDG